MRTKTADVFIANGSFYLQLFSKPYGTNTLTSLPAFTIIRTNRLPPFSVIAPTSHQRYKRRYAYTNNPPKTSVIRKFAASGGRRRRLPALSPRSTGGGPPPLRPPPPALSRRKRRLTPPLVAPRGQAFLPCLLLRLLGKIVPRGFCCYSPAGKNLRFSQKDVASLRYTLEPEKSGSPPSFFLSLRLCRHKDRGSRPELSDSEAPPLVTSPASRGRAKPLTRGCPCPPPGVLAASHIVFQAVFRLVEFLFFYLTIVKNLRISCVLCFFNLCKGDVMYYAGLIMCIVLMAFSKI